jgi:predicted DNA-binding transcriptional regulator YafY
MRADRLLSILLLLQVHRRIKAGDLARRLEVSERTIYRDMEALSMAGVPVIAERGPEGGWSLLEPYETNLTGLNGVEIQSLFLPKPSRILADLGLEQAYDAALTKLLASLPSLQRHDAEFFRQRIYIESSSWRRPDETLDAFPLLQQALWQERRILMDYVRSDGAAVERLVDPLGLVAKGNVWYLIAAVDGELRTYRVSRIQAVEITDVPCTRPADFDLAVYWQKSSAAFVAALPQFPVRCRVDPAAVPRLRTYGWYVRIERIHPPDEDGWVRIDFLFEIEEDARAYILGFGSQIEVLDPPALREAIITLAKETVALYDKMTG